MFNMTSEDIGRLAVAQIRRESSLLAIFNTPETEVERLEVEKMFRLGRRMYRQGLISDEF